MHGLLWQPHGIRRKILRNHILLTAVLLLAALCATLAGCAREPDRLYALRLDRPPDESDWAGAGSFTARATGGQTSLPGESDVDKDSVHMATASCHHGTGGRPVKIWVKAFYTASDLYMRFSWQDPTADRGPEWTREGARWKAGDPKRDGLGILWGLPDRDFDCATVCHLKDWRKAGGVSVGEFAMASRGREEYDFWVWKTGRTGQPTEVEDGKLGPEGRTGDGPDEFEIPNSALAAMGGAASGGAQPFGGNDAPLKTPGGEPGDRADAFFVRADQPSRTEIEGRASRGDGVWTLTLKRPLAGLSPEDVKFEPGGEYSFGLAVLDGVARDHNAALKPVRMKLVGPGEVGAGENGR